MYNAHDRRFVSSCLICAISISILAVASVGAEDQASGTLAYTHSTSSDGLKTVTSVEVSGDGRFLYASAWQPATITVFRREAMSGELTQVQELKDPQNLQGATAVRLSPDGRLAVASAFGSKTAVLFRRNPEDGKLTQLDVARDNVDGVTGLQWAVDVAFSPDSKFVYVIDSRGPSGALGVSAGSVTVFQISDDELVFVESAQDSAFADARGIVVSPDGKSIAVTASEAGTLIVLNRLMESGKTTTRQVLQDGQGEIHGLSGAMGVAMSSDGQFIYVSSGRFGGADAIGVYQFDNQGELSLVQELVNETSVLKNFEGGNEIVVSPDGGNVYAVASGSGSLACFQRDDKTGKLRFLETIPDEQGRLTAAAGVCLSPDGEFVYVAAEQSGKIAVFRRQIKRK